METIPPPPFTSEKYLGPERVKDINVSKCIIKVYFCCIGQTQQNAISLNYRVPAVNLTLYIFGPTSSHIYPTGQNEVPLEPQRPNEDFGVSHAEINHS